jgi:dolichol-phosphate mannosyltransferase
MAVWTVIGVSGLVINTVALWLLAGPARINYLVAAVVATQFSSAWNFALVDVFVYRGVKRLTWPRRLAGFLLAGNVALLVRVPLLALLVTGLGFHYLVANVFTMVATFLGRFALQEKLSLPEERT